MIFVGPDNTEVRWVEKRVVFFPNAHFSLAISTMGFHWKPTIVKVLSDLKGNRKLLKFCGTSPVERKQTIDNVLCFN